MASRFSRSNLHQRDPRPSSSLFDSYSGGGGVGGGDFSPSSSSRPASRSPGFAGAYGGYSGVGGGVGGRSSGDGYMNGYGDDTGLGMNGGYRSATPNKKGHYSDAVLSSLESQNDSQVEGISAKVRMLKDLSIAIGDEIRDSTAFAEKMNDTFEFSRVRIRGTMNRMLRMAERTGVGWRVWLGFFLAVFLLFAYVWVT